MIIQIEIKNCRECKHCEHTGGFTKGGAKPGCNHPETVKSKGSDCFKRVIPNRISAGFKTIREPKSIPNWCPMKNGFKYQ